MKGEKKAYQAPQVAARGKAVDATQIGITGPLEPGTAFPKMHPGDTGFGL